MFIVNHTIYTNLAFDQGPCSRSSFHFTVKYQRHTCFPLLCTGRGKDNTMMQFGGAYSFLSTVGRGSGPASDKSHSSQVCPESCLSNLPFQHSYPSMPYLAASHQPTLPICLTCPACASHLLFQALVQPAFPACLSSLPFLLASPSCLSRLQGKQEALGKCSQGSTV